MFFRQYLPVWAGGTDGQQAAKGDGLFPMSKLSTGTLTLGNNKPLAPITATLEKAQEAIEHWIINFQNLENQIKLPNCMSPVAKQTKDEKIPTPKPVEKPIANNNKESILHLPNTRIQHILDRVMTSIEPDHAALLTLANNQLSFHKPVEKDREIKMADLSIKIARKLRGMVDDIQLVISECLLDEEIGVTLLRIIPGPIVQSGKELGDQLLKKHIQESIDKMQDYINKYARDFMKVDRSMHRRIEEMNRRQESITPDRPDAEISLTLPSTQSSL